MTRKRREVAERISGIGKVFRDEDKIASVRYHIQIIQEYLVSRTFGGESAAKGLKEIIGELTVLEGERDLMGGDVLTLELEDGRIWTFFANRGDPISGNYSAVNAAGEGLEPKSN